jgi:molybdenum cofactor synthesis domain-containing protein
MTTISLPSAIYIATGNELIAGEKPEINVTQLAKLLNKDDIRLCEVRILPDDVDIISNAIVKTKTKYDFVFVSGGIGIREDDVTAVAIAKAFGVDLVLDSGLLKKLKDKYPLAFKKNKEPTEMSMAYIPNGAEIIDNEETDVPGFIIENVYVLPGAPKVFKHMVQKMNEIIKYRVATFSHSAIFNISENKIKDIVDYVNKKYENVDISIHPFISCDNVGCEIILKSNKRNQLEQTTEMLHNMVTSRISDGGGNTKKRI